MGTKVLSKFSFEMFLGRLNLAIVENAHAYCVQIMKLIMFWNVPGRAHCVCFVQKFWLALWSLPIFLIGTLPCTMACTQHVPLYRRLCVVHMVICQFGEFQQYGNCLDKKIHYAW